MINDTLYRRKYVIVGILSTMVFVYIARLFMLQVADNVYAVKADNNAFLKRQTYPSRGLIFDRNDSLLVFNEPAYDVTLIMREMRQGFDTVGFCRALKIDSLYFAERIVDIKNRKKNRGYSSYTPQVFMSQLSPQDVAELQQNIYRFHGAYLQNRDLRGYTYPSAAHVLGGLSEVSRKQLEQDDYYRAGDYRGSSGLESVYECVLRGEKGLEILLRDSRGRIQGKYKEGIYDVKPVAGSDVHISIDIKLQQLAEQLLAGKRGSVVALEPSTGEILAMASSPAWDPAELMGRQASSNYRALASDKQKPLYNRATQAQYPPGSTFKILQALIALEEGVVTTKTTHRCHARGSKPIRCTHDHGDDIEIINAIEQSCNPYFWCAFRDILEKNGYGDGNEQFKSQYDKWRNYVLSFGYGARFTDTDIYIQSAGYVPTRDFYKKYYGETGWRAMTIRSLAIGQGEILTTPLQMVNALATVANEGYYVTPHFQLTDTMEWAKHEVDIDKRHFGIVKEGMHSFFLNSNARFYQIDSIPLCGKTGTVQNNHGEDHSLFVGFAPKEDPVIALAVVVENAGFGAVWAMPMGSLLMEQYIKGEVRRKPLFKRLSEAVIE